MVTLKLTLFREVSVLNILAFIIGAYIVYLHIILLKSLFCKHLILLINLFCLSETYLDSSISIEEKSLIIDDYKLLCAEHPRYTRRGWVCIYHKEAISVQVLKVSHLPECLVCEVSIQNKRGLFVTPYRSPSQSHNCFQTFLKEFEKLLSSITKKELILL